MRDRTRGQSLVEFALVIPVFLLILGGVIQLGFLLWGSNTLNQVVRDTGRFAATLSNCTDADATIAEGIFDNLATNAGGPWSDKNVTVEYKNEDGTTATACPVDNTTVVWVDVVASARAPIFFPIVPGGGQIGSSTRFRVEPQP